MKKISLVFLTAGFLTGITSRSREIISGHTHLRSNSIFESGSPIRASIFNSVTIAEHNADSKSGFQFVAYGGKNTRTSYDARYFMPYGHKEYTVQAQKTFTRLDRTYHIIQQTPAFTSTGNLSTPQSIRAKTFAYDPNTDTSFLRPWNFGITFASTYDGDSNDGTGTSFISPFTSTISPELHYSRAGIGAAFRHHFSNNAKSFWFEFSTAIEAIKSEMQLHEIVTEKRLELTSITMTGADTDHYTQQNISITGSVTYTGSPVTSTTIEQEVSAIWLGNKTGENTSVDTNPQGTGWPATANIQNITQAFAGPSIGIDENKIWKYGKIMPGGSKKCGLADIEFKLGYNFSSNSYSSSNGYLGLIIPTGTRTTAEFLDEARVGNGHHWGVMIGGTALMELGVYSDLSISYRMDCNSRYLAQSIQKRSFDLIENEGSRWLMVWERKNWSSAKTLLTANSASNFNNKVSQIRNYSAGINFFTKDMYVTPRFQTRCNQALLIQSNKCKIELGWNLFIRQAEKISLVDPWTEEIAFPDAVHSPFQTDDVGVALTMQNKTYKNGRDLSTITSFSTDDTKVWDAYKVHENQINLKSAASPRAITNTPYATIHYDLGETKSIGVGGSYEFADSNAKMNEWNVWGKFELSF